MAASPITAAGIQQLIAQLGTDLARVEQSLTIPPDQKQNLRQLITQMRMALRASALDTEESWPVWIQDMRPHFDTLSTQLNAALGEPKGACQYVGGCIQTSSPHCDALSGVFFPSTPC